MFRLGHGYSLLDGTTYIAIEMVLATMKETFQRTRHILKDSSRWR